MISATFCKSVYGSMIHTGSVTSEVMSMPMKSRKLANVAMRVASSTLPAPAPPFPCPPLEAEPEVGSTTSRSSKPRKLWIGLEFFEV